MPLSSRDARLVEWTTRGDTNAYAELVRAHQAKAIATAHYLCGNFEDAQDIAQEAFVTAYQSLQHLRKPASFGPWLCGIIRNLSRKHVSRRPPETASLQSDDIPDPVAPQSEGSVEMLAVLQSLPTEHREVLAARYLQDMDYEEIAEMLRITPVNARVRCFRAKQALRRALDGAGGEGSG